MAEGYEHRVRGKDVAIFHHGKLAKLVRGVDATALLKKIDKGDKDAVQEALSEAAGGDPNRPGGAPKGTGKHLGGDGRSHAHGEFRRKSG